MPTDTEDLCPICRDPNRYRVEQLYLEARMREIQTQHRYSRHEVEAHMGHVADPSVVRVVAGLSSATAVAARMRQLEQTAGAILEAALTGTTVMVNGDQVVIPPDLKLALSAAKEVRATLVELSKLADAQDSQQANSVERVGLDDAIADYLRGRGADVRDAQAKQSSEPAAPLELMPPSDDGEGGG